LPLGRHRRKLVSSSDADRIMICASCAAENKAGRQFCAACGAALPRACANCGFVNEPADAFCGGCGRALGGKAEAGEAAAERRPVSVLFVDLVGYTALVQKVDPEETHAMLARFFAIADEIILQFGGRIDKHMGDNVMALFGAPIAHGDDPQRAVSAAQAIHAAMPALSESVGRPLAVHIGVAVGEVLASGLGSAAHSSYTVVGQAVNLAARLMEMAGPGETLVSSEIAQHLAKNFHLESCGSQAVKGLPAPVTVYRVGASMGENGRGSRPMIGRRAEIAQIDALLAASRSNGAGVALLVRGVPGIGKSHLAEEAMRHARRHGFHNIILRILDFGLGAERDPHRQLARALAEAADGIEHLGPLHYAVIAPLTDRPLDADQQRRLEAMGYAARHAVRAEAMAHLFEDAAARQPILIAIEDIHWADADFLSTLAVLADKAAMIRATLLMTSRTDPDPIDATWRASLRHGHVISIDLAPMSEVEALEMSQHIATDLDQFTRHCVARAEGNPLFLEQLLRNRLSGDVGDLPDSLQNVVLARLDQLPEAERLALQAASILGQQFSGTDLANLLERPGFDPASMLRRQLLRPVPGGYLFAHALIHDGIYSALTRERRRALHRKAAALYAERDLILHAEHLDRAEATEAAAAYAQAADAEGRLYHLDRAARLAARGLEIAQGDRDRCRLGLAAGRRHLDIGEAQAARKAFAVALDANPAPLDQCRARIGLAACDRQLGDIKHALHNLALAEPLAADDPDLLAEIFYLRGNLHFARGDGEECLACHSRALAAAQRSGTAEWLARAESGIGDAFYMQGRYAAAAEHFRACIDIAESAGLMRIVPTNRAMFGNCQVFYCRFDEGLREIEQARAAALRIGDRFGDMFGLESRAFTLMSARRWAEAAEPAEAAFRLAGEIGAKRYESITAIILAMSRRMAGDPAAAEELCQRALQLAEETGLGFAGALIEAIHANILGPGPTARQAVERGEDLLRQTSMAHNHIFFRAFAIDWAMAAGEWNRVERYAGDLAQFTAAEPLPYVEMIIERARLLARLQRDPGDAGARPPLAALAARARLVDFRLAFPD
jgi:class 3 adenylate cyclase/tetratricopeptide (TPR) repeat protein